MSTHHHLAYDNIEDEQSNRAVDLIDWLNVKFITREEMGHHFRTQPVITKKPHCSGCNLAQPCECDYSAPSVDLQTLHSRSID